MLLETRRRALGLLIAAFVGARTLTPSPRAFAQDDADPDTDVDDGAENMDAAAEDTDTAAEDDADSEEEDCIDSKAFGTWKGQASDVSAGASQNEVPVLNPDKNDLLMTFEVNSDYDARIYVEGSLDGTPLPEDELRNKDSRLIAKRADGKTAVDTPLCGNCTDIYEDTVSLVLPLATAPVLREQSGMTLILRLADKGDYGFEIDCVTMRKAIDWAVDRRDELQTERDDNKCASVEGCFITTACCEAVGLADDCFELRTLRRYRDHVLAKRPGGAVKIARYYKLAPQILGDLRATSPNPRRVLLWVYARYVLPAAIAARLGLNETAYRLYLHMLDALQMTQAAAPSGG